MEDAAKSKAPLVLREALFEPLLFKLTALAKLLPVCVKLMALAPALKVAVPPTVNAPVCPMPALAAVAIAVKFVPIVEAAKFKALVFVIVAVVPLLKATFPVKLLLLPLVVKSIAVPAFRVVVPGTTTAPVSLMAAPAVRERFPLLINVMLGKIMFAAALLKLSVRLRKAESEPTLVGTAAAAFVLVRLKSWMLPKVAPEAKVMAPLILFAWLRLTSAFAPFSVKVKMPVAEAAWVRAPV